MIIIRCSCKKCSNGEAALQKGQIKRVWHFQGEKPKQIKWGNMLIFISLFAVAGYLSETATKENWKNRKAFNLCLHIAVD